MARHCKADSVCCYEPACCLDARHPASVAPDASDLAMFDNVYAGFAGGPRISPGDRIVAHRAAAWLQKTPKHRKAAVVEVDERYQSFDGIAGQSFGIHAEQPHHVRAPRKEIALRLGMEQIECAALADHRVEIQLLLEPFPQFERELVEADVVRLKVI